MSEPTPADLAVPVSPPDPMEAPPRARRGGLDRRARIGGGILLFLVAVAILAPWVAPHSPESIDARQLLAGPTPAHPFGSDALGRDVLSRVMFALRVSLGIAVGSVAVALVAGSFVGLLAGYFGGWLENLLMRPVDMLLAFPALLLAISLIAIVGPSSLVALVAISVIYFPIIARVVRGSVLVVSRQPYVEGARVRGASHATVLLRHVLPNSLGPALVQASVLMGFALQLEAALSFLGLGAQPPTPSLGLMLSDGRDILTQAPWAEVFPGVTIAVTVLAFNLLGDGLRHRLAPGGRR